MEENKPVETTVPPAGEEQKPEEAAKAETGLELNDVLSAIDALKDAKQTLTNAETKIVHQNKKIKRLRDGEPEESDDSRVEELVEKKLAELWVKKDEDEELKQIANQKAALEAKERRLAEIAEALKAKATLSSTAEGTNQDKLKPQPDYSKELNADQKALYQRIADGRGLSLDVVLKAKAEAEQLGIPLIQHLKKYK